ncbi:TetR family transcriptional regulator [Novosphingobium bradum]|uniref:TetR family transcriptional regulator n=1 Tax=Novosphingobium bradum TaxID=1737444 RepID=A0ABV7ILL4_9SPHN
MVTRQQLAQRPGRTRAERGSISAEQILAGAKALAQEIGLDALSMPRLAAHLGIGVTSIYWYFRNKDALIAALTVDAARSFHPLIVPAAEGTWQDSLFETFTRLREAMRADDLACDLLFMRGARAGEDALAYFWPGAEAGLARMVAAGFTPAEALQNITILSLYNRGCVVLERQMRRAGVAPDVPTPVPADYPLLSAALEHQNTRGVSDEAHAAQLRAIIEGMALRLDARKAAHP